MERFAQAGLPIGKHSRAGGAMHGVLADFPSPNPSPQGCRSTIEYRDRVLFGNLAGRGAARTTP
jgi:hypothetical protein